MKKYYANLSLQAQVPENQLLEPHFKQSIQFDILCPVSGCKEIKANGFDTKFADPVQFYKCKAHGRNFYAHTSWLMKELAEVYRESKPNLLIHPIFAHLLLNK